METQYCPKCKNLLNQPETIEGGRTFLCRGYGLEGL
jgi:hypothetical protein